MGCRILLKFLFFLCEKDEGLVGSYCVFFFFTDTTHFLFLEEVDCKILRVSPSHFQPVLVFLVCSEKIGAKIRQKQNGKRRSRIYFVFFSYTDVSFSFRKKISCCIACKQTKKSRAVPK
jgi:hypothetical protein